MEKMSLGRIDSLFFLDCNRLTLQPFSHKFAITARGDYAVESVGLSKTNPPDARRETSLAKSFPRPGWPGITPGLVHPALSQPSFGGKLPSLVVNVTPLASVLLMRTSVCDAFSMT